MDVSERRQFWCEFINLFKSHKILWQPHSFTYKDSDLKKQAYRELVQKLSEAIPTADLDLVKRKINMLKACFRRELDIRERAKRDIALGIVKEREPKCYYFKRLRFLHYQDEEKPCLEEDDFDISEDQNGKLCQPVSPRVRYEHQVSDRSSSCDIESDCVSRPPQPQSQTHCQDLGQEEEAVLLGKLWTLQYRSLTAKQRMYAQKAISDVFFEAKMDLLRLNSVKINE